jgi:hypothetical protein
MNSFESFLLSDSQSPAVGPEVLEMLGRKAAGRFLSEGVSLNDSIRELVGQHPELQNEHIKRVVEFANNVAFQEMFSKSEDKNVHFDIADPGIVIRDLKDGGSPAHAGKAMQDSSKDYTSSPSMTKQEFGDPESGMQHLQSMSGREGRFGQGEQIEKQASIQERARGFLQKNRGAAMMSGAYVPKEKASCGDMGKCADWRLQGIEGVGGDWQEKETSEPDHHEHANPVENVYDMRVKLAAARDELARANEQFNLLTKTAREELYQALKSEIMDPYGAGINGALHALTKVASKDAAFSELQPMVIRLTEEQVPEERLQLTKTAAKANIINYDHPLIRAWSGLVKAAAEQTKTEMALGEINRGLRQVNSFIQEAVR